jgi:Ribonuclease G/E
MTQVEWNETLEKLVDSERHGLTQVLITLGGVCQTKAQHIRESYSDEKTARTWENVEKQLDRFTQRTVQPFGL